MTTPPSVTSPGSMPETTVPINTQGQQAATARARPGPTAYNADDLMLHIPSINPSPSPALSSICDKLGTHVPHDKKRKIWRREFIDLAALLPKNLSEMIKKLPFTRAGTPKINKK